ncbi:MAG: sporulation protein YabP [Bacilli bacterium]|nr:sporulation protein YabP [Bacilli bacterium]
MNNSNEQIIVGSHEVKVFDRSQILLTGIKKITSFDNEEFLMESSLGMILLKGEGLEILKLDTHDGNVKIKGKINSFNYIEDKHVKSKDESIIAKLFK